MPDKSIPYSVLLRGKKLLQHSGWKVLLIATMLLAVIPLFTLFINLDTIDSKLLQVVSFNLFPRFLWNTLIVLGVVIPVAVGIGSTIAWITAIYDFPLKRLIIFLQVLPLLIPSYVLGITWNESITGKGVMYKALNAISSVVHIAHIPTFLVLTMALVLKVYPYVFLILYSLFSSMSQSMIDMARSLNRKRKSLFLTIGISQAKGTIISIVFLMIMELLNEYWIYQYFGYNTISSGILRVWQLYGSLEIAKVMVIIVVMLTSVLVYVKRRIEQKNAGYNVAHANPLVPIPLPHRGRRIMYCLWGILPVMLGFILPVIQLILWANTAIQAGHIPQGIVPALKNTAILVILSTMIQIPLALLLSFASRIWRGRFSDGGISLLTLVYCVPNSVVAVLFISAIGMLDVLFPNISLFSVFVNNSLIALVVACVYRYMPMSLMSILSGFHHENVRYEQAARSLQCSPLKTLVRVCAPVNVQYIVSATLISVVDIIKDIPMSLMLHPFNFETLALKTYHLVNDEFLYRSSIPSLLLILLATILVIPVYVRIITRKSSIV